jgi:MFS family permease
MFKPPGMRGFEWQLDSGRLAHGVSAYVSQKTINRTRIVQTRPGTQPPVSTGGSILEGVTWYHWLVVLIASCGWLFDCMDQRLFNMARESALNSLKVSDPAVFGKIATATMMIGWATGGILFGMLSDRWGRVKTMVATLLVYSGFTGLCGLSQSWVDFTIYRFLVGLGVGGMFGAATTLVAESVPQGFRAVALGSLQALSAMGNITASFISLSIPPGAESVALGGFTFNHPGWRLLFFVGILPSLLVVPIMFLLKEPEAWKRAKAEAATGAAGKKVGSIADLISHPRWRRNTLVGLGLGVAGMVGLWAIGFFSPELVTTALKATPLQTNDLRSPVQLCVMLQSPTNPAIAHIQKQLTPQVRARIATVKPASTGAMPADYEDQLRQMLVPELKRIIHGASLLDTNVFQKLPSKLTALAGRIEKRNERDDITYLNRQLVETALPGQLARLNGYIDKVRSKGMVLFDVGALLGMFAFTFVASKLNRRKAFLASFVLCLAITAYVFYSLKTESDAYWMLPLMGFAQLAVFAGYSIYFPELYPTRLRGTGVGSCYNTVRYLTAIFIFIIGYMETVMATRTAAILMSSIYLVGIVTLIWAPETKDQPLPED